MGALLAVGILLPLSATSAWAANECGNIGAGNPYTTACGQGPYTSIVYGNGDTDNATSNVFVFSNTQATGGGIGDRNAVSISSNVVNNSISSIVNFVNVGPSPAQPSFTGSNAVILANTSAFVIQTTGNSSAISFEVNGGASFTGGNSGGGSSMYGVQLSTTGDSSGVTVDLEDATITGGNAAAVANGSGFRISTDGNGSGVDFTMEGGTITGGNITAAGTAHGVQITTDDINSAVDFNLKEGEIKGGNISAFGSADGVHIETDGTGSDITFETAAGTKISATSGNGVTLRTNGSSILAGNTINGTIENTAEILGVGYATGFYADANGGGSADVHVGPTGIVRGSGAGLVASAESGGSVTINIENKVEQTSNQAVALNLVGLGTIPAGVAGVVESGSGNVDVTATKDSVIKQVGYNPLLNVEGVGMVGVNNGTGYAKVTADGIVNATGIGVAALALGGGDATVKIGGDITVDNSVNGKPSAIGALLPGGVFDGTVGGVALSSSGAATVEFSGNVLGSYTDVGLASVVLGGSKDATITLNPADPVNDPSQVNATTVGLAAANLGSGKIMIDNEGSNVQSAGTGALAIKLGKGDVGGGDSVVVKNVGATSVLNGTGGPGVSIIALDLSATIANNVSVLNDKGATITGSGALLGPGVGILADGAAAITNDNESTIGNAAGQTGLAIGVVAGANASVVNDRDSTLTGLVELGSTSGNATLTNDRGSSWSFNGLSTIGADILGTTGDATVNNDRGGQITAGLDATLAVVAGHDATINNDRGADTTFLGDSANLMVAGNNAKINNDRGGSTNFLGTNTNVMVAGADAEINNSRGGSFFMAGLSGNAMVAGDNARINNDRGGSFTLLGGSGNLMVAGDNTEINNARGGDFVMGGLNGQIMVAGADAIINNGQSSLDPTLDGPAEMSFVGLNGNLMVAAGDATINNVNGSKLTFAGLTASGMIAGDEASINNDDMSEIDFIGINVFGFSGTSTTFNNDGYVRVNGFTTLGTALAGLDLFNNHGIVSMVDGASNDTLALSGNYDAASDLWIDAELTPGGNADLLVVGGNTTGVTHLSVNDLDNGPGQYDPDGVLFAIVSGNTDPTNFTTDGGIDKGLFRYDAYLRPNDPGLGGDNGWYLASTLDQEAYEFASIMAGAQALWTVTTGTWLDRTADLRSVLGSGAVDPACSKDCMAEPGRVTPGLWMKAVGATQSRDDHNRSNPPDGLLGNSYSYNNSYDQDMWGFLIGADAGKQWTADNGNNAAWLVGVMGGYVGSKLDFDHSNTTADYSALSLGVYTTYLYGGFFIDGTLKADFGTMDYDSNLGGGYSESNDTNFTSIGGMVDTGYRIGLGASGFFEPKASLAYVSTSMDNMGVLGTNVNFEDGDSLLGRLGARIGASIDASTMRSELYLEGSVWDNFEGDYQANLISNGFSVPTKEDVGGAYGEVKLGANLFGTDNNWNGFIDGAVQFGDNDYMGYSGNVGVRYSW